MLEVAIISANPETLDGLSTYFGAAGIRARCTRHLDGYSRSERTNAFVFFPDDYRPENVASTLAALAARRPHARSVLVTANPKTFAGLAEDERVVIVPKPAWASAILDAVRASQ